MKVAAVVLIGLTLAACNAEGVAAQQPSPRARIVDLSRAPIPSLDGQLVIGDGLAVFGLVARGAHETEPSLVVVEMLTSQTSSQLRMGDAKIDAMSFVYDLDCATMRYRLNHQVSYERTGQPVMRTNLNNAMIEGPMASYLKAACGQAVPDDLQLGENFSSMEGFLSVADPILEPRLANLPRPSIIVPPRN
jgi:hypothetical protein